jgi:hypothetical protein
MVSVAGSDRKHRPRPRQDPRSPSVPTTSASPPHPATTCGTLGAAVLHLQSHTAPNPPRCNVFMKVLVTDADGHVWDLETDVYTEERKPIPWIWNTRLRKMNRRIIGSAPARCAW